VSEFGLKELQKRLGAQESKTHKPMQCKKCIKDEMGAKLQQLHQYFTHIL
jgi:hypothetical protein